MAIAARLADAGRAVEVIDDQLTPGGGVTALGREHARDFEAIRAFFTHHVGSDRITLRSETVAGGVYGRDLMVVGPAGAEILEAQTVVLACGAHDGALAFEGNDVPGVMSARAAGWLLAHGVLVGKTIVVVESPGGGPFGASFQTALAAANGQKVTLVQGEPLSIRGSSRVRAVRVRDHHGKEHELAADAVLVDAPRSPAYELAEQAGARVAHEPRGYVVRTDAGITKGFYATGELTGTPLEAVAIDAEAARLASVIAAD